MTIAGITQALLDRNPDVIAYVVDDRQPVTVARSRTDNASVVGNDVLGACPDDEPRCIGATYWNWGPMYKQLFAMLLGSSGESPRLVLSPFDLDAPSGVASFAVSKALQRSTQPNDQAVVASYETKLEGIRAEGASWSPFGGRCFANASPRCVNAGQSINDDVLRQMCSFVEGAGILDGTSPAAVPVEGDCAQ